MRGVGTNVGVFGYRRYPYKKQHSDVFFDFICVIVCVCVYVLKFNIL